MKVPSREGRVAMVAGYAVALVSIYLLFGLEPQWQSDGTRGGILGSLILLGLLRYYRTSMRERAEIPIEALAPALRRKKTALSWANKISVAIGITFAVVFIASSQLSNPTFGISPMYWGVATVILGMVREFVSVARASREFVQPN